MRIVTFAEPCGKCGVNEILPQAGGLRTRMHQVMLSKSFGQK